MQQKINYFNGMNAMMKVKILDKFFRKNQNFQMKVYNKIYLKYFRN